MFLRPKELFPFMTPSAGERRARLLRIPSRLSIAYLIVGALWILLSDWALEMLAGSAERAMHLQSFKGWFYVLVTSVALYAYAQFMVRSTDSAERKARAAELDFRRLMETTGEGVWVTDAAGRTLFANPRVAELTGLSMEVIRDRGLSDVLDHTPVPAIPLPAILRDSTAAGLSWDQRDELKLIRSDGTVRWVLVSETPMTGEDGRPQGTLRVLRDNTARRGMIDALASALEMQKNLMSELDHRVRNNLASLVAIVQIAAHGRTDVATFAGIVVERVRAMATAYSLLAECRWSQISMRSLVAAVTSDAEERRVLEGPESAGNGGVEGRGPGSDPMVSADQIVPLTLLLHELTCNARDHGALRQSGGRLSIRWRREVEAGKAPMVVLEWTEIGGPKISRMPEFGFGLTMAQGLAASDLQGRLDIQLVKETGLDGGESGMSGEGQSPSVVGTRGAGGVGGGAGGRDGGGGGGGAIRFRLVFPERPPGVQFLEIPEMKTLHAATMGSM